MEERDRMKELLEKKKMKMKAAGECGSDPTNSALMCLLGRKGQARTEEVSADKHVLEPPTKL
eukprot:761583-Hanusia_phi.AAC.2